MPQYDAQGTVTASRRRLVWSAALAAGAVLGAVLLVPGHDSLAAAPTAAPEEGTADTANTEDTAATGPDRLKREHRLAAERARARAAAEQAVRPHDHSQGHRHDDPATKNSVSRSTGSTVTASTADPTTARQAARGVASVVAQRAEPDPRLRPVARRAERTAVPRSRYAMAGGCYALKAPSGRWVARTSTGFGATAATRAGAEPFHFQATDLGRYLLFGTRRDFVTASGGSATAATAPGPAADWRVTKTGKGFSFRLPSGPALAVKAGQVTAPAQGTPFRLRQTTGCASWPEVGTGITGRTFRGISRIQEVRGLLDAHTHGMAFEFLGGDVHCGRPWHPYGVTYALVDCPDHQLADGKGAALEDVLKGANPGTGHDPVGWPTFKDWPAADSLTHEGTYYKWLERSWRGGLRVFVNLLVENDQLCKLYPLKHNSCDDMDSIRLQAKDMRAFQRYIDAQFGGPGKGWYRIVTNPFQARRVINKGKLAVVMGIETSVLFGCTMKLDIPACTKAQIDQQLDEVHRLGVRQMELVNKFDNALSGVAGDQGTTGVAVNAANFLETGSFWGMKSCPASYGPEVQDKEQTAVPPEVGGRDSLLGAISQLYALPLAVPLYPSAPHCNLRGLTDLGAHTIRGMVEREMIFDPDHMSVLARKSSLDLLESLRYSGVISSHSWATPDAYPRIYRLGGVVAPYAGDSAGFVDKWRRHLTWADPRFYFGFGYGADINGFGAQGSPRGAGVANPVTYPFKGLGGVTVRKQRSGSRVYDVNVDGVAHYGLYPDWLQDLRKQAGRAIVADMGRGPEAYLEMWERAVGVTNDACRQPKVAKPVRSLMRLPIGATVRQVLLRAGQPHSRLGDEFAYCARSRSGSLTKVRVAFGPAGRLTQVR